MQGRILFTLSFLILPLTSLIYCNNEPADTPEYIAKISDDITIDFNDIEGFATSNFYDQLYSPPSKGYEKALNSLINNHLSRIDFFESGMHENPELTQSLHRIVNEEVLEKYFEKEYLSRYVNEKAIQEEYEKLGRQITYRQIVLNKPEASSSTSETEALQSKVTEIRNKIDQGTDFGELVTQYSEDYRSARNEGYMDPVTWEESLYDQKKNVVLGLEEGEVRTIDTDNSYHIVKVTEVNHSDVAPLAKVEEKISEHLNNRYNNHAYREFINAQEKLVDTTTFDWNEEGLTQLTDWSETPGFYSQEIYNDTLNNAITNNRNFTILSYSDGEVDLKKYLYLLNNALLLESTGVDTRQTHRNFITEALQKDKMIRKAREENLHEEILSPHTDNSLLRSRIVNLYYEYKVESQIPEPTHEALTDFYETHKDTLYYQYNTVNTHIISSEDEETAKEWMNQYRQGADFADLTHSYQVRSFYRDRDDSIQALHSRDEPVLGEIAFDLEEDEVRGPVEYNHPENGRQFALIRHSGSREARHLSFEEAEEDVIEDFTDFHRSNLEDSVFNELRHKYSVDINRELLEEKFIEKGIE